MTVVSSSWSAVCRSFYSVTLCAMLFAFCGSVDAQQTGKVARIGYLDSRTASGSAFQLDTLRQELSKLGWIEGKNITIEYRFAEQKLERLSELAGELVRLKVDLIVVSEPSPALAAKSATTTIPIVMMNVGDPVAEGLSCQSGTAGRQYHRSFQFKSRAKYQKARDTQRRSPQTRSSWAFVAARTQHNARPPTERA